MRISLWVTYLFLLIVSVGVLILAAYQSLPDVDALRGCLKTQMHQYYLCRSSPNYVPLTQISPYLINAILVSEDATFFEHHGFDWYEIKKTIEQNFKSLNYKRGASTISQQLVKNVFLSKEKSIIRKIREAILTIQVEKKFTKSQILESYLNVVEFAPNIYGVKSAANYYFGKSPSDVDVLESAFLAFVLPNPKRYQESFKVKNLTSFARRRLSQIVHRLARFHKISTFERDEALERLRAIQWLDQHVIEEEDLATSDENELYDSEETEADSDSDSNSDSDSDD